MNYFFAGLIYSIWTLIVIFTGWDNKISKVHNVLIGVIEVGILTMVHWVPFWLIFLR